MEGSWNKHMVAACPRVWKDNGAGSKLSSHGHMGDKLQGVTSLEIQNELSLSWVCRGCGTRGWHCWGKLEDIVFMHFYFYFFWCWEEVFRCVPVSEVLERTFFFYGSHFFNSRHQCTRHLNFQISFVYNFTMIRVFLKHFSIAVHFFNFFQLPRNFDDTKYGKEIFAFNLKIICSLDRQKSSGGLFFRTLSDKIVRNHFTAWRI